MSDRHAIRKQTSARRLIAPWLYVCEQANYHATINEWVTETRRVCQTLKCA